jgi:transposase
MQRLERDVSGLDHEGLLVVIDEMRTLLSLQQNTITQHEATIAILTQRIKELEARPSGGAGPTGMPGIKPASRNRPPRKEERKPRSQGYARRRSVPTEQVEHKLDKCPECQTPLQGGSVHHRREVIEIPVAPAKIVEHVYIGRECPKCQKRRVAEVELEGEVFGHCRFGINLMSLITTLKEEGRLPVRTIQWYLQAYHQLKLSVGSIVAVCQRVAEKGKGAIEEIKSQIQASEVVNVDETGWRQDGNNGYTWSFSTPLFRYFIWGSRAKGMVDKVLGDKCLATLVSDFYSAYNHYTGLKQRCWVHLLRDVHELTALWPDDGGLKEWAKAIQAIFVGAKSYSGIDEGERYAAQLRFEQTLLGLCQPYIDDVKAVQAKLSRRIGRHIKEMFVFVAKTAVPADNNGAERSLRHLVIIRKISGGTRSAEGTETKMALASLFGTWRAQGLDPFLQCRLLLSSP